MAVLQFNVPNKKYYEDGNSKGVLYVRDTNGEYPLGVAWEGLINAGVKPSGEEPTKLYAGNTVYAQIYSNPTFDGSLECYTYPEEFNECNGFKQPIPGMFVTGQSRKPFGISWRSELSSDGGGVDIGYRIHLVYGAVTKPAEVSYASRGESAEAITLSFEYSTVPLTMTGQEKSVSYIWFDSTALTPAQLTALEEALYGTATEDAYLPLPDELTALLLAAV